MEDIRFLETHGDVFFAGKNFGKKFLVSKIPGLILRWDEDKRRVVIHWNNRVGWIFEGNCAFIEPEDGAKVDVPMNEHKTSDIKAFKTAQVSTPMGHVFEGLGHGKTGKSRK